MSESSSDQIASGFRIGDRVLIERGHPWHGHTGNIEGEFHHPHRVAGYAPSDLCWTVRLDSGQSCAASEKDLTRVE